MDIDWKTQLYCLIGNPVDKSLSPIIHNNIFKELKEKSIYLTFNVEEKELKNTIEGFKAMKVKGFNVTIPYKKKIVEYLDYISPEVEIIGAVNTVKNENGKLVGYNTDGEGFVKTFHDNKINLKDKVILLLGAGGAASGIASALIKEKVQKIYINNRNIDNALALQKQINLIDDTILIEIGDLSLDNINKDNVNIIINSTSVGMHPMENMSPIELSGFSKDTIIYDVVYKPRKTQLIKDGMDKGYRTFGGISMLLNQAIISQKIWLNSDEKINMKIAKKIEGLLSTHVE